MFQRNIAPPFSEYPSSTLKTEMDYSSKTLITAKTSLYTGQNIIVRVVICDSFITYGCFGRVCTQIYSIMV
jgi:hypothetical protein